MSLLKLMTVLKGGPGSGNFGHAGRPGKHGGSAPGGGGKGGSGKAKFGSDVVMVNNTDQLKSSGGFGKAYFVLPDDSMIDATRSGGDHAYAAMTMAKYDPKYDVPDSYEEDDFKYNAVAHGAIAGRSFDGNSFIILPQLDSTNLRRLQKLVDDGKIKLDASIRLSGNSKTGDPEYIDASMGDVMFAKGITTTVNGKIKLKMFE